MFSAIYVQQHFFIFIYFLPQKINSEIFQHIQLDLCFCFLNPVEKPLVQ